jgi:hypothetical protein
VKVIGGLDGVADILGGWDAMPRPLQNPLASVKESEINWIRAAILKKYGGLWVSPSTIWLQPIGKLPKDKTVFFGMDDETPYADGQGTRTPGLRVVWSPKPDEPLWVEWEARAFERLDAQGGGRQIRHDDYSDAYEAAKAYGGDIEYRPLAERSRKGASGRRIEIEDILSNGIMPFDVTSDNLYVPVPWPELRDRSKYGWFLRMSEEQIMESNLTITALFHVAAACPSAAAK